MNLANLRRQHRAAIFSARTTKAETLKARQEVDTLHLQLQNLYYEQRHLEGEITSCEDYDHKYRQLPLIPVEEFLALHSEHANADENDLMVARIEHERSERENLEKQRQDLLKRKAKLIAENKKRKDDLANLDKDLEKFIDVRCPVFSDRHHVMVRPGTKLGQSTNTLSTGCKTDREDVRKRCMITMPTNHIRDMVCGRRPWTAD
ncbi:hypothetical protein RB594_005794 [Gaeumannomyces avenae]